ncbi:MAG TPA: fluoride efflux transporter CrcB [Thermoanaerobaculia bacterium]|nr:fluoride efflux transporter CrcB [Thermoanaerobaculia bacterium]
MARLFWVCLGGAVGSGLRYLLSGWVMRQTGPGFPYGTLAVNVLGSFLLGAIMEAALMSTFPETLRLALTTGVMGGFTTYSTFNYETLESVRVGDWGMGIVNVSVTVLACLVAGVLGLWTGRVLAGR